MRYPLLNYAHEFIPIDHRPQRLGFWETDNPTVSPLWIAFQSVFGYAHGTTWRAALWSHRNRRPLLLYSDSNARLAPAW